MHGFVLSMATVGSGTLMGGAEILIALSRLSRNTSVDCSTEPGARHQSRGDAYHEHERDQDKSSRPCEPMPFVVRTDGIGKDLERERRNGLAYRSRPELVSESGEKKGCGLTSDARDSDQRAGSDPRQRSAQNNRDRSSPFRVTQREGGLSQ